MMRVLLIDLHPSSRNPHRREDLLTKMAGAEYRPGEEAPAWEAFVERVLPDEEVRRFVQRAAGYGATGDTSEQCMFINHGAGANGKSTFQEALAEALGDYAMRAPTEMLMAKRAGGISNDVARLKGARFVAASETEEGRRLAESLVKDLTGQDTITARFMRAEFFDFKPTHKLWLSTNHKPEIRGTDNAIWRRIRLIPWSVAIPPAEQDRKLPEKLRAELAGVLAWIVRGCLDWRREGLGESAEVRAATEGYRAEMDVLATFMDERCVLARNVRAKATPLYHSYRAWCETAGERAETQRAFGMRLTERGLERKAIKGLTWYEGIALRDDRPDPGEGVDEGRGSSAGENPYKSQESAAWVDEGRPKNAINANKIARVEVNAKKGLHHLHGLPDAPEDANPNPAVEANPNPAVEVENRRLTPGEAERAKQLMHEGMKAELARAEVLGPWAGPAG